MSNLFSLHGRVAVITGASGALGGAMAKGLAEAGAHVALCCGSNVAALETLAASLPNSVTSRNYRVDSRDTKAIAEHAAAVKHDFGRLDIVVNCVGGNVASAITGPENTFFDLPLEALEEVVHLNLFGGCVCPCYFYGREMKDNAEGGSIINITSMNTFRPLEGRPGYAASKAAVTNFTQWLATHVAKECNPLLRVNAIAPGFIPNARTRSNLFAPDGTPSERGAKILAHTPMGRMGEPDDLVGTCVWYASDASRYVTGTVTPVDGGFNCYSGV